MNNYKLNAIVNYGGDELTVKEIVMDCYSNATMSEFPVELLVETINDAMPGLSLSVDDIRRDSDIRYFMMSNAYRSLI